MTGKGYHGVHERLTVRLGERRGEAVYTFVSCALALGVSGLAAYALGQPLIFPSLGPTAFLFFEQPAARTASPRNTLIGHLVAVVVGALCLALFGLYDDPSILVGGVTLARVGAAAVSLALTGAVLLVLRASHPPSGATVLIVSLGLLKTPAELAMILAGVVLLIVAAWSINRALGTPVPVWSPDKG